MSPVKNWYDLGDYYYGLGVPKTMRNEIRDSPAYQTEDERKVALLQYFLVNVPMASWQSVAGTLYWMKEKTSLQLVKPFPTPAAGQSITEDVYYTVITTDYYVHDKKTSRCFPMYRAT